MDNLFDTWKRANEAWFAAWAALWPEYEDMINDTIQAIHRLEKTIRGAR
jgi:hypothetical protein